MPSFCIAEAIKRFEHMRKEWITQQTSLQKHRYEVLKSTHLQFARVPLEDADVAFAQIADRAEAEFWDALGRVCRTVHLLDPTPGIVDLTRTVRDNLKLDPADAAVVATVIEACRTGKCDTFI